MTEYTGVFACKMVPFVQSTAIVTEILTMTCIAAERHNGIVHPLKMKWQYTNRRAYTMLGIVWLAAAIVGSPMWHVQRLEVTHGPGLFLRHCRLPSEVPPPADKTCLGQGAEGAEATASAATRQKELQPLVLLPMETLEGKEAEPTIPPSQPFQLPW
ncbi:UNVERIFIED_CONTAM: hypothetical protein K2H54_038397 [Gekko kuhli]